MRVTVEPDLPRYSMSGWCDCMFSGRFTQTTLRALDWLASKTLAPDRTAQHLRTGRQGEEDAYFYLRRRGYVMIARNYRSPNYRGELDLVGWDGDVLCFIEVKTRTTRAVKPAEAAVDRDKQKDLSLVAGDFLRHMPASCQTRFDIVSIYYDRGFKRPSIELFQNAFSVSYNPSSCKHEFARSH
jgi:putative endonuclease